MDEKLPEDQRNMIKESKEPILDSFGRVTFFHVEMGDEKLPIYQPGSVMFESAVKSDSEIVVKTANGQQNGAILGNGCAIFLAKFLTKLVQKYNCLCADNKGPVLKRLFKKALE